MPERTREKAETTAVTDGAEPSRLLTGLVRRIPGARGALLLTVDGLVRAAHGLPDDTADHLAACASGVQALARGAGARFPENGGGVRRVVVETHTAVLFVCAAGPGTCLAVVTGRDADAAVVGYEMAALVRGMRPALAAPVRQEAGR